VGLDERPRGSTWPTSKVHYNSSPRTSIEGALVRGVLRPSEGSKILSFLFRSRLVCSSLLHLRSSYVVSDN
jgi:hypothetical protein